MLYVTGRNYPFTSVDSVVCSVVFADILNQLHIEAKPVLLNSEGIQATTKVILDKIPGFTIPDVIAADVLKEDNASIAIVDHNHPKDSFGRLGIDLKPLYCVDHHEVTEPIECNNKMIEKVGSCGTTLLKFIDNTIGTLSDEMATALAFAILTSTRGLKSKKTTNADKHAVSKLFKTHRILIPRIKMISIVQNSINVEHLSPEQIRDNSLQEYYDGNLGIAAIEVNNQSYLDRFEDLFEACWRAPYNVYMLIVYESHTQRTIIHAFNRVHGWYKKFEHERILSRSTDILPAIKQYQVFSAINKASIGA